MATLTKKQAEVIKAIHADFDSTQERLLMEAKSILSSVSDKEKSNAQRLSNIGFISHPKVRKLGLMVETEEQAKIIEYYKFNYPFLKFLTIPELDRICKKYNLIYAPIRNYIEDVPEKNISEIESAQSLKKTDNPEDLIYCKIEKDKSFNLTTGDGASWCGIWGSQYHRIPSIINGQHFGSKYIASEWLRDNMGFTSEYLVDKVENITVSRQGLFIAAPQSHFNTNGLNKEGDFGYMNIFKAEVKDPIVFRYCKGGIQVISKWGLEGADEMLVNEKSN